MKRWLSITAALFAFVFIVVYVFTDSASGGKRLVKTQTINAGDIQLGNATPSGEPQRAVKDLAGRPPQVLGISFNGGGAIAASSANFSSGVSVAQSAMGKMTSVSYRLGIGFWYVVGGTCCKTPGDADGGGSVNIGDATFIVKYVFQGGGAPPCCDQADADFGGSINIGDATFIVKFVFQGGAAPQCPNPGNLECL